MKHWEIDIHSGDITKTLGVHEGTDKRKYTGNSQAAIDAITDFCTKNNIRSEGFHGYGSVTLKRDSGEEKKLPTNPYGIDITMMLDFCEIAPEMLTKTPPNNAMAKRLAQHGMLTPAKSKLPPTNEADELTSSLLSPT